MPTEVAPSTPTSERRARLLIVDDEPVIVQILKAVFEDEPYELFLASSGTEALEIMRRQGVDLLLTDKNLPDINGLELLQEAKRLNPDAEVIIITGYASLETALAALELDAFDYVLKPLNNVFDIKKKAQRALERQRMVLENRELLEQLRKQNDELQASLEESRHLQDELIQSEKLAGIGTLAAGIAHEVSSPLFGIMGLAEAIQDEEDAGIVCGYARDIVEYCQSVRHIVTELTSYSRTAQNEYLTSVEFDVVIQDAVRLIERSVDLADVRVETEVPAGLMIDARTNEIQQVFVNLIKNAVEALHERGGPGLVLIKAGLDEGYCWAEVCDNGPGIAEDRQPMVFDPFYTTKAPGKGTGLGLNIVYRIVTKYRGSIHVENGADGGTTFRLRFPTLV
jgi:C4-dicarboxylate-specific signal transduction histidine kinase